MGVGGACGHARQRTGSRLRVHAFFSLLCLRTIACAGAQLCSGRWMDESWRRVGSRTGGQRNAWKSMGTQRDPCVHTWKTITTIASLTRNHRTSPASLPPSTCAKLVLNHTHKKNVQQQQKKRKGNNGLRHILRHGETCLTSATPCTCPAAQWTCATHDACHVKENIGKGLFFPSDMHSPFFAAIEHEVQLCPPAAALSEVPPSRPCDGSRRHAPSGNAPSQASERGLCLQR